MHEDPSDFILYIQNSHLKYELGLVVSKGKDAVKAQRLFTKRNMKIIVELFIFNLKIKMQDDVCIKK